MKTPSAHAARTRPRVGPRTSLDDSTDAPASPSGPTRTAGRALNSLLALVVLAAVAAALWLAGGEARSGDVALVVGDENGNARGTAGAVDALVNSQAEAARLAVPETTPLDVGARATAVRTRSRPLHVVDARTGTRIRHGTILSRAAPRRSDIDDRTERFPPPRYDTPLVDAAPLPDRLAFDADTALLWFTSEGYRWTPVIVVRATDAPLVVPLERGSHVTVELGGAVAAPWVARALVVVDEVTGEARRFRGFPTTRLGFLPLGRYRVGLPEPHSHGLGRIVAERTFDVVGDDELTVRIDDEELAPVGATLVVEYRAVPMPDTEPRVELEPLAPRFPPREVARKRGSSTTFADVEPGRYALRVGFTSPPREVELTAGEVTRVTVEHDLSATIELHGEPGARIAFHHPDAPDDISRDLTTLAPSHGFERWQVPAGEPLVFQLFCDDTSSEPVTVVPEAGLTTRIDLPCRGDRPAAIAFVVRHTDADDDEIRAAFEMRAVGHAGRLVTTRAMPAGTLGTYLSLVVSEPGAYRVTFTPPGRAPETFVRYAGDASITVDWHP